MKTLVQKIYIEPHNSFAFRLYRTPDFETNWHIHEEFELILITEGSGTVMIGDYVGDYFAGDLYFIAANLPHWFRKSDAKMIGAAKVMHAKPDLFNDFLQQFPEMKNIQSLLLKKDAVRIEKKLKTDIINLLAQIESQKGFQRLLPLFQILNGLGNSKNLILLTQDFISLNNNINPFIEKIIDYSFKHFLEPITLAQVSSVLEMSVPNFCRFFKRNIKKSYFNFLQELRIGHACKLLNSTKKPILEICYESGYNSWAHFSKQFKQVKSTTPSMYRKQFEGNN